MQFHKYADDLQLYTTLRANEFTDISNIEHCTADVSRWFLENAILLNPAKSEAVIYRTRQRMPTLNRTADIGVAVAKVQFADTIKRLGVRLDSELTFNKYVIAIARSCNYHLRALRH